MTELRRVLVTGGTGFIGRYLLQMLVSGGVEVVAITSKPAPDDIAGVQWLVADLLNEREARAAVESAKADALIHLAWYAVHGKFWTAPENFAWVCATQWILEQFHKSGGQRAVLAGTCAEYDWASGYCIEDQTPLRPRTVYGQCKDASRRLTQAYCEATGLSWAWGRIFFPYGFGEPLARLLPSVIRALDRNEEVRCSHGGQYRDFIAVEDTARAFIHLALGTGVQGAFNVSSGQPVRLRDLVELCVARIRPDAEPVFGAVPVAPDDPPMLVGDNSRLKSVGWRSTVSIDDGVAQLISRLRAATNTAV